MKKTFALLIFIACSLLVDNCLAQGDTFLKGATWLSANQNTDGSWGAQPDLELVYSAEAVAALISTGTGNIASAVDWISSQNARSTDELSRTITSLVSAGTPSASLVTTLTGYKNTEGGWGYELGNISDPLDTALALQALKAANYSDITVLNQAISYLTTNQNSDGGWGFTSNDASNAYVTANVSYTIQQFTQTTALATAINKATTYLINYLGSPATVYETALVYKALSSVITDATVLGSAVNYLTSNQLSNGSWNDDPYSTALALQALHIAETRPSAPPPTPAPTTGTVNGTVVDGSTNQPLSGVSVILAGNSSIAALTDSSGSFSLTNIPQGPLQFAFSLNGYAPTTATLTLTGGSIANIGSVPLSVIPNTGIVQGKITEVSTGGPLPGATITVTGNGTWTATTASDGTFKITSIAPGNITLSVSKSGYTTVSVASMVTAERTLTFSPSLAIPLPPATTGRIMGKVIASATGLPLQGATISCFRHQGLFHINR